MAKTERLSLRFTSDTMKKLIKLAAYENRNYNNYIETLIEREYKEKKEELENAIDSEK